MVQAAAVAPPLWRSQWPRFFALFVGRPQQRNFSSTRPAPFGLLPVGPNASDVEDEDGGTGAAASALGMNKSRNELKREAHRAVRWGMELAKFTTPHIKRVLRIAALDRDVFDALMLVKRFGPDVREGRRRQFSYIGKLLREAQPELMDDLIQASKDGDTDRLLALSGHGVLPDEDDEEEDTFEEVILNAHAENEESEKHIEIAARWFDGLVERNPLVTSEVYSIYHVEFDRQELRKLVRRVQSVQEGSLVEKAAVENEAKLTSVKKPLTHFLRSLAKKTLAEQS